MCGTEGFAPKAFCIAVLKMFLFVVSIFYFLYRYSLVAISTVQHHWQNEFNQVATYHFEIGISIFLQMFAFLLAITLISFFATKKRYQKNLMMTFQELKEEYKESEGSAEVKSRRKEIHQEILLSNIIKSVRKSRYW